MDNTLWERCSAKFDNSGVLGKEQETNYAELSVIITWMLMLICEMERSILSVFTELKNENWKKSMKNRMCSIKYKVLPSIVKMNILQNSDASLGLWRWAIRGIEKQTGLRSNLHEELFKNVQGYNHFRPQLTWICAYPSSIRTYVEDVIRTPNASQVDLMRHEWARYQTYSSFPKTSKAQPIILSRAGFYYTGNQDETTCFSCELKYKNWQSEDSPWEKHRQMSPDCAFLKGSDGRNVAIERDGEDVERQQQNGVESVHIENRASEGVNESFAAAHYPYASLDNHTEETLINSRKAETNEQHEGILNNVVSERKRSPDICKDRAKHPHYAILSNRLASFTGWLGLTNPQPRDLASAGFYYVGMGDSVQCFFCGGGLRSWQNGDDPYVEHARWYPDCDYIRIYRGDEYLQQHSRDINSSPETSGNQTVGGVPGTSQMELEQTVLRTTAAQSIISMGYTIQQDAEISRQSSYWR
ncbi:hypothetical protein CHS0354_034287 [Potamilus streckersoni]|uniref:Uncharacterized protein n=1 Tax=Potamilus streckersoni TaxID=2493646 RepID=A0AAE0S4J1_9BIVA|nr:hypothetical protein CHS0354_034287 [Potamilus streckersoni]